MKWAEPWPDNRSGMLMRNTEMSTLYSRWLIEGVVMEMLCSVSFMYFTFFTHLRIVIIFLHLDHMTS